MGYIYREILDILIKKIHSKSPYAAIISGIVGCGKTTMVESLLKELQDDFEIFRFTGDDIVFRRNVSNDSNWIYNHIHSTSTRKALVFVDEVQKTEEVFDALKIVFDKGKTSFIVSGSNPEYLSSVAKKRLQRRAEQIYMLPLSLSEIFCSKQWISPESVLTFYKSLLNAEALNEIFIPKNLTLNSEMQKEINEFLQYGGLPLSYLQKNEEEKLVEIRLTVERGFDLFTQGDRSLSEIVKYELANLNSKEFSFQNIMNKARIRQRAVVTRELDGLINHGYLVKKQPMLLSEGKTSYLSVFSFVDPGIATYLRGEKASGEELGFSLESYVHARLTFTLKNSVYPTELGYFKPHVVDKNEKVKYLPGEIDFILKKGRRLVPIECKLTNDISQIDTKFIRTFLSDNKSAPFGVVLYGGVPFKSEESNVLYWPYWMI